MNTITDQSLYDVVEALDNAARAPALRGIANSSMAKCIGAIRQHIRDQARNTRDYKDPQNSLDKRNEFDEDARAKHERKQAMGFPTENLLEQASLFHAVHDWATTELLTIITNKWDAPLTIEQMLEFMKENASKLDRTLAQALADAVKTNIKTIERMHELQSRREQEQLTEIEPEIVLTFKGFGDNGYAEAIDELPKIVQHQLGVKVVESLNKARNQVLSRVLRTRRIADLGSVPIIEDAAKQVSHWVEQFEKRHSADIQNAIDDGRNVRTLEEVATL